MPKLEPGAPLPDRIRQFLDAPRYATLATVDPDGKPRTAMIWYRLADDGLVINSLDGRRWPANLRIEPRLSLAIHDQADPLVWVGLSGEARADEDRERGVAEISEMARRYHADRPEHAEDLIRDRYSKQDRVTFDVRITEYHDHLDG